MANPFVNDLMSDDPGESGGGYPFGQFGPFGMTPTAKATPKIPGLEDLFARYFGGSSQANTPAPDAAGNPTAPEASLPLPREPGVPSTPNITPNPDQILKKPGVGMWNYDDQGNFDGGAHNVGLTQILKKPGVGLWNYGADGEFDAGAHNIGLNYDLFGDYKPPKPMF